MTLLNPLRKVFGYWKGSRSTQSGGWLCCMCGQLHPNGSRTWEHAVIERSHLVVRNKQKPGTVDVYPVARKLLTYRDHPGKIVEPGA